MDTGSEVITVNLDDKVGGSRSVIPRHRALMRRLIAGMTLSKAAEDIGFTVSRASLIVKSPLFQAEMKRYALEIQRTVVQTEGQQTDLHKRIEEEAGKSLDKVVELRDKATSERVQQISAFDILDRAGYGAKKFEDKKVTIEVGQGLLDAIERTKSQSKVDEVVDVTHIPVIEPGAKAGEAANLGGASETFIP